MFLQEMEDEGVSIVIYSTPCLFSAKYAIEKYLVTLAKGLPVHAEIIY